MGQTAQYEIIAFCIKKKKKQIKHIKNQPVHSYSHWMSDTFKAGVTLHAKVAQI